jgi:quercetin dioxygenase-like cupin family protein
MNLFRPFAGGLLAVALITVGVPAFAHDDDPGATVRPVMQQALPEAPGKDALIATVSYAPGQASAPHHHPGSIFAYVIRGHVVSQLAGGPEQTYGPGEGWYEPPGARHIVSRNASDSEPAEMIVFALASPHDRLTLPLAR